MSAAMYAMKKMHDEMHDEKMHDIQISRKFLILSLGVVNFECVKSRFPFPIPRTFSLVEDISTDGELAIIYQFANF